MGPRLDAGCFFDIVHAETELWLMIVSAMQLKACHPTVLTSNTCWLPKGFDIVQSCRGYSCWVLRALCPRQSKANRHVLLRILSCNSNFEPHSLYTCNCAIESQPCHQPTSVGISSICRLRPRPRSRRSRKILKQETPIGKDVTRSIQRFSIFCKQ